MRRFALSPLLLALAFAGQPSAGRAAEPGRPIAASRCAPCHGVDGNTANPDVPKLAGQLQPFLALQLRNYKSGERPHPAMVAMARSLSEREIDAVARYYASQPPMRHDAPADAALLQRGEAVFKLGKPGAPACQYCHGAAGQGLAPVFARLAGQNPTFIVAALQPYRKLPTFGNPYAYVMKAAVQEWSDEDIRAVAAYVASLR